MIRLMTAIMNTTNWIPVYNHTTTLPMVLLSYLLKNSLSSMDMTVTSRKYEMSRIHMVRAVLIYL